MRMLKRNLVSLWYALYLGETPITVTDEYGNEMETGEYEASYSDPVLFEANMAPPDDTVSREVFGGVDGYSRVIIPDSKDCPVDENTVLWVDGADPEKDPFNYIVKAVRPSLNHTRIALSKVTVK